MPEPPRGTLLAAELVCNGADLVVVGGSARWLRHGGVRPRDLDVVVAPRSISALVVALARLDVDTDPAALRHRPPRHGLGTAGRLRRDHHSAGRACVR